MNEFWTYRLLNNEVKDWAIALAIIAICLPALRLLQAVVVKKIKAIAARTETTLDDFLVGTLQQSLMPLLYILVFYLALRSLQFPATVHAALHAGMLIVITFFFLRILSSFVAYAFHRALVRQDKSAQREKQSRGILLIVQVVIWLLGFLFLIDNLGYDITTLVAGLGIGGIAIALAAQTVLGDLFSYLVIFFDKPFEVGDFIIMDDKLGTVEYIGIKTTRIRTLSGEQLVCANTDLTNSRVHNYKRMQERRVVFSFGVVYATPAEILRLIPQRVKAIIDAQPQARFDRAHFKAFGAYSLDFEVVFYVLSPDYNVYMDIQQEINLRIFEALENEEISFALPVQNITLQNNRPVRMRMMV
ncbi:MAG TPA: mechanosensitive ion channel family protein [Flavisolibacter sp.]|jgi:small-conductance mechanosensitive channel|nr:mechanosensitive ion channel family protein [Flavisolibacter sp.]